MSKPKFTDKEDRFIDQYMIELNASKAAKLAGYSAKTARQAGSRLLSKVNIQEELERRKSIQKEKFSVSFEEKQELLLKIASYGIESKISGSQDADAEDLKMQQINPSASVAAIKELNLMDGDHAAQKIQTEDITPPTVEYVTPDEDSAN